MNKAEFKKISSEVLKQQEYTILTSPYSILHLTMA
ncbi:hypothetical protein D8792_04545 [Streptococcus cristatus]|uniref:Uncharacterized protein n=1 Tax=Streptococcus cristatus TaxID=45634 RepID=A0A428H3X2_STRCR|nr:hypothetical protein D8792_04545 [Streptococcus cristatus]